MRKSFLLFVLFCLLALAVLAAPVRRHREGDIPHFPPCHPGEVVDGDGMCHCPPVMDCQL